MSPCYCTALQTGYYDIASKRYVLFWLATAPAQDAEPIVFVAVSQSSDPLGQWVVKGLKIKPSAVTFKCTAAAGSDEEPFFANYPQVGDLWLTGLTCLVQVVRGCNREMELIWRPCSCTW